MRLGAGDDMFNRSTQYQSDTLDGRALGLGLLIGAASGAGELVSCTSDLTSTMH